MKGSGFIYWRRSASLTLDGAVDDHEVRDRVRVRGQG
jgi:hypothetical protein